MKRIVMAIMAVAAAVTFSTPSFATGDKQAERKGDGKVVGMINADDKKKEEKKGGYADTFGNTERKDEKGKK